MKKVVTLLVTSFLLTACHTPIYKIETAFNTYNGHLSYYKTVCQGPTKGPVGCTRLELALAAFLKADQEAALANTRGGSLPVQLQAVKDTQKAVDEALANMDKP